jgi:hypothetical protein
MKNQFELNVLPRQNKSMYWLAAIALALLSASASAFIVEDPDGTLYDCHYDRNGNLRCMLLDYQPPLDP